MVFFTCDQCGESLKKNQVQRHFARCKSKNFSCIDCQQVFDRKGYNDHVKCITENQKYGGAAYEHKEFKGEVKQNQWVETVRLAIENNKDPGLKKALKAIEGCTNIPRKEAKFLNFCKNSGKVRDTKLAMRAWQAINYEALRLKQADSASQQSVNEETDGSGGDEAGRHKKEVDQAD